MKPVTVNIIGGGNVARQLTKAMLNYPEKIKIVSLWNRHPEKWKNAGLQVLKTLRELPPAKVHIIAVKDDAINELSRKVPSVEGIFVHTSGVLPMDIIAQKRHGVFYPLQSLSANRQTDWTEIPILVEASHEKDLKVLRTLAAIISRNVRISNHMERKVLHVAAVFASNFSMWMYEAAYEILKSKNIPFDLLFPLIEETAAKLRELPPAEALTGPAKRNDLHTIEKHLDYLKQNHPEWTEIYLKISEMIIKNFRQKK